MVMPWGKYRGEELDDVPSSYLCWLVEEADRVPGPIRLAAEEILEQRFSKDSGMHPVTVHVAVPPALQPTAREIVDAGVRTCAKRRHPDTGGTHEAMLELDAAAVALRRCAGAA